jgi:hypothetical protein
MENSASRFVTVRRGALAFVVLVTALACAPAAAAHAILVATDPGNEPPPESRFNPLLIAPLAALALAGAAVWWRRRRRPQEA